MKCELCLKSLQDSLFLEDFTEEIKKDIALINNKFINDKFKEIPKSQGEIQAMDLSLWENFANLKYY